MKTNSNNINNSKSSKTKSIIALTSLILVLSIANITLLTGTIFGININTTTNASALSYSTSEDISFTFAPTLSIGLSTDSLTIDNLVPGTTNDSNTVTVTVSSNTPYGYVLSAGVGSNDTTSPYYNTSSLTHENSTISNVFSSVDTNASLDSLDTDNTWGYSTSTNGGTSWSTYSGLSHTATKPLLDISDPATPSTIDFKIAARSASTQASGTYNNVITFYAVGKPEPHYLYEEVARMSKGTQTAEDLKASIYKSNSGVYEYDSAVFGEPSDASNTSKIYYYRGIIDNSYASSDDNGIGSSGDGELYPNYIKFSNDICWRIVRTTGSGGIKMIYNGVWNSDSGTCANAGEDAQIGKTEITYSNNQIVRVGFTFNNNYANGTNALVPLSTIFGSNNNDNLNTTDSKAKIAIDNWYINNISAYTTVLESSAGYCGDRTVYDASKTLRSESATINQIGADMTQNFFGSYVRNTDSIRPPTLTCAKSSNGATVVDRGRVDLYSVKGSPTGNGKLTYPISLLTADEASFAGSGSMMSSGGSRYTSRAFLRSGQDFWLLSPYSQGKSSPYFVMTMFVLGKKYGDLVLGFSSDRIGLRPVVSLKPGTEYVSGSGTATDPWVVPAP